MKYEAIIFDWDGTLVDSAQRIVESMQCAAQDSALQLKTPDDIRQIIGLGFLRRYRLCGPAYWWAVLRMMSCVSNITRIF